MIGSDIIGSMIIGGDSGTVTPPTPSSAQGTIHFALGGIDLDGHVIMPVSVTGLERKTNVVTIPGNARSILSDEGITPLEYDLEVVFSDLDEGDTFIAAVNSLLEDATFYPGYEDWYHTISYMTIVPKEVVDFLWAKWYGVHLITTDPYIYSKTATRDLQINAALPYTSAAFENDGSANTPFESIRIIGRYASTFNTISVTAALMNGASTIDSILLSDALLSDEIIDFQNGELIICTYDDHYPDLVRNAIDKYSSSGTITQASSCLEIAASSTMVYKLVGPNPTSRPIELTMTATKTGSPIIEYSTDGATWYTTVATADIYAAGTHIYNLAGTEHCGTVYVRFNCPAASTLSIDYIKFVSERTILGDNFIIPPDGTRTVVISDAAASSSHRADVGITFRERKWP